MDELRGLRNVLTQHQLALESIQQTGLFQRRFRRAAIGRVHGIGYGDLLHRRLLQSRKAQALHGDGRCLGHPKQDAANAIYEERVLRAQAPLREILGVGDIRRKEEIEGSLVHQLGMEIPRRSIGDRDFSRMLPLKGGVHFLQRPAQIRSRRDADALGLKRKARTGAQSA